MKKNVVAMASAVALSLGLFACGGSEAPAPASTGDGGDAVVTEPEPEPASAAIAEHVEYKDWSLDIAEPEVVWSDDEGTDVLVLSITATNNGDEARSFATVDNLQAYPEGSDSSLGTSYVLMDLSASEGETEPGETVTFAHAWALKGTYGSVRVAIQGYSDSPDDTELTFSGLEASEEAKAFEEAAAAKLEAQQAVDELSISGATVVKPEGWHFGEGNNAITAVVEPDEGSGNVKVTFATTSESAFERALKFAGNFGKGEADIQTVEINGVEWAFYRPTDTQFDAYAVSSEGGCVNARGMNVTWEDAQGVMACITVQ